MDAEYSILDLIDTSEAVQRFKALVEVTDGCHIWRGKRRAPNGYGIFKHEGRQLLAHRIAWAIANHYPPWDKFVLHSCDNKQCVNPDHLRAGTHEDNMRDYEERQRAPKRRKIFESGNDIRALRWAHGKSYREIAAIYGLRHDHVRLICHGYARSLV